MTIETPTVEPSKFTVGDTVAWKKTLDCFKASDGWVLTYSLRNVTNTIDLTATASGDDHLISLTAVTTSGYTNGEYWYQAYATKGSMRYQVDTGMIEIKENLAASATYDGRSHVKKVLDALEATILGKASKDQLSYSIQGRSLSRMSAADVIEWRDKYKAEYQRELRQERLAKGLGTNSIVKVRFTSS